jgi:hypothetical protein
VLFRSLREVEAFGQTAGSPGPARANG